MKKQIKIIGLIYLLVAVLTYALTLRIERLDSVEDINNHNQSIVLKLK